MQWITLQNLKDANGNQLEDKDVYGYYVNNIFVECNYDTGKPTGKIYYGTYSSEETAEEIIVGHESIEKEDMDQVKRVDPVEITLMAPNIINKTQIDLDHYNEAGEIVRVAYGPAQWPGPTKAFLIPGSDPDYWLIVARVTNPNSWPVKARVHVDMARWSDGSFFTSVYLKEEAEVYLGAKETRFVLMNRGKKDYLLSDNVNTNTSAGLTTVNSWTKVMFGTSILENYDPELPEYLKPGNGYIAFENLGFGIDPPKDLSNGFIVQYYVKCTDNQNGPSWFFEGLVKKVSNGWEATPYPTGVIAPEIAKQKVEEYFSSFTNNNIPIVKNQMNGGIYVYSIDYTGGSAKLYGGPINNSWDVPGPTLVDYNISGMIDYNGNANSAVMNVDNPTYVGWAYSIPVYKQRPMFIETYEFVPIDADDIGMLKKEKVLGYNIYGSEILRPHFNVDSTLNNYKVESLFENGAFHWKITINHDVKINAINPDNVVGYCFSNVKLSLPNVLGVTNSVASYLKNVFGENVLVVKPDFGAPFIDVGEVTINPGDSQVVYNTNFETVIMLRRVDTIVNIVVFENIVASLIPVYINWNGEAMFSNYGNTSLKIIDNNSTVFSLNQRMGRYTDNKGKVTSKTIGLSNNSKWFAPMSYFNPYNDSNGLNVRISDEVWMAMVPRKELEVKIQKNTMGVETNFWPYIFYSNSYKQWRTNLIY